MADIIVTAIRPQDRARWTELWRIRLPFAVPFIFSGLKAAIALAVVGAVVAEFVNADAGLGYLIQTSTAFFKVQLAWGALLILSIMGIVLFQLVVAVELTLVFRSVCAPNAASCEECDPIRRGAARARAVPRLRVLPLSHSSSVISRPSVFNHMRSLIFFPRI